MTQAEKSACLVWLSLTEAEARELQETMNTLLNDPKSRHEDDMSDGTPDAAATSFDRAMAQAESPHWSDRADAARALKHYTDQPMGIRKLVEMLDDMNLAVVEEAVESLMAAGLPGYSEVLKGLHELGADPGYSIIGRLSNLVFEGIPVIDWARELLTTTDSESVRQGALE